MKIAWQGGACPVPAGTKVRVYFRNGQVHESDRDWVWSHTGDVDDIVEYEVLEPAATQEQLAKSAPQGVNGTYKPGETGITPALSAASTLEAFPVEEWLSSLNLYSDKEQYAAMSEEQKKLVRFAWRYGRANKRASQSDAPVTEPTISITAKELERICEIGALAMIPSHGERIGKLLDEAVADMNAFRARFHKEGT